ncbi:ubiquitin carboxyl-terminal hydrolase 24 isoform X2 [Neltuma alba]|uniref:ubiquitin carboxyl-terminal hydrolase 24 isoform X2 n=1 Tax=Neltuma alba TaxID=207710 RepID=UPI0010A38D17|nr:ubiquitin carboxyl-terminal hydrolase 24 isoform X2 [Prosopis alba]
MSDSKVLLFGSFSEDETRSLLLKQTSGGNKKPVQKNQLQFGSLNFSTEGSSVDNTGESSKLPKSTKVPDSALTSDSHECDEANKVSTVRDNLPAVSLKISESIPPSDSHKRNGVNNVNIINNNLPGISGTIKENGSIDNVFIGPTHRVDVNEVKKENFSHTMPSDLDGPINQFASLKLDDSEIGSLKHVDENGSLDQDPKIASNGHVTSSKELLPRGLINSGNLCFLNASVQALLSCSHFVQLLQELRTRKIPKAGYPTLTAFVEFIAQFDMPNSTNLKKKDAALETGRPFCPVMFEGVLKNFTPDVPNSISGRPRQEDAQEFLSFVMDQMHIELLKLEGQSSINGGNSSLVCSVEDDEWETVGPKNKSAVTRTQSFLPSELSEIFGGQLRSLVRARGNRASATIQPYLLLHLDIYPDAVNTIENALHLFSAPETLEGFRTSTTGKAGVVSARKSVQIQTLSKIMILHLMRFSYGSQGSTKLHKPVHFPLELILGRDLLVSPTTEGRRYELVATITHHGREPSKGHYTADARYSNGRWLRFDDASVSAIGETKVLHDQAYVLFYKQV